MGVKFIAVFFLYNLHISCLRLFHTLLAYTSLPKACCRKCSLNFIFSYQIDKLFFILIYKLGIFHKNLRQIIIIVLVLIILITKM